MRISIALAILAAVLLLIPPLVYASQGESFWPYLLPWVAWLIAFVALYRRLRRTEARSPRWSRRGLGVRGLAIGASALAVVLAVLSIGLATRYALTPHTLRSLDVATHRQFTPIPACAGHDMASYVTRGDAKPQVVFVHGTPGHAGVWAEYLLNPIPGVQSVAVDRPGYARSAACGPLTSFEAQADAIAAVLKPVGGVRPVIVGHSLGGPIAACIAARHPDRVGGLVIVAGSLDPDLEAPAWYNIATEMPGISAKMPASYQTSNAEIAAAREQTVRLSRTLEAITCPVIVLHGDADELVPVANVDFITRRLINAATIETTVIPGMGHGIPLQRPDLVRSAVVGLVSRMVDRAEPPAPRPGT